MSPIKPTYTPPRGSDGVQYPVAPMSLTSILTEVSSGVGSPEGLVAAPPGSTYLGNDGSGATTIYFKVTGIGNTGWIQGGGVEIEVSSTQSANYTLSLSDHGLVVEGTKATAQTITVPPNSSVPFAIGTVIEIVQMGVGQITIVAGSGVTLYTAATLTTRTQYSAVTLRKRAVDEWVVGGDLT